MNYLMRELRDMTGLTQKAFADRFGIPLSTLRKWEQGEASPAGYVVNLIASKISAPGGIIRRIPGLKDTGFYYNPAENTLSDGEGNVIHVCEDLALVKQENLSVYVTELFEEFYRIREKFNRDCRFDMEEDIIWSHKEE